VRARAHASGLPSFSSVYYFTSSFSDMYKLELNAVEPG